MKLMLNIVRWFTGVLFIFSGLIKLNDPVGTQIKFEEYFEVFSKDIAGFFEIFIPLALPMAVIFCVLEVVIGVALLIAWRMKLTSFVLLALIVFFTFLTFYSAYFNKVTDCGCFGDAIKLTPWQSFSKDVVLLIFSVLLVAKHNTWLGASKERQGNIVMGVSTLLSLLVALYALVYLPPIDFRAYKVGNNIQELRSLPPGAKQDVFEIRYELKNTKTGETKSMTDKEYIDSGIWEDSTWTVEKTSDPILVQKGDRPKIIDFSIFNKEEGDITDSVMKGNYFIVIVRNASKVKPEELLAIHKTVLDAATGDSSKMNLKVIALTGSSETEFDQLRHEAQLPINYYNTDGTVLKTIMRTNVGTWLLKDGVVKGKWSLAGTPDFEKIERIIKEGK